MLKLDETDTFHACRQVVCPHPDHAKTGDPGERKPAEDEPFEGGVQEAKSFAYEAMLSQWYEPAKGFGILLPIVVRPSEPVSSWSSSVWDGGGSLLGGRFFCGTGQCCQTVCERMKE